MRRLLLLSLLMLLLQPFPVVAAEDKEEPSIIAPSGQLIEQRRAIDRTLSRRPLSLVPHRPTYLVGGYYIREPQTRPFEVQFPNEDIGVDPFEIKFQISLKTLIISDLIGRTGDLWVGYTNRSFWQAFNSTRSSPFRETNHEPEAWFDFATDKQLGPIRYKGFNLGVSHQSNGQWGELSRSWNRVTGLVMFEYDSLYFALRPWWRIPESDDDNPDIDDYMGNFEFYAFKVWHDQTLGLMLRNNLDFGGENHGAVQLDYTFPIHNQLHGYLQVFSGYGESLIDYDHEVHTVGFGLMLANWL